jgi:hypothetical protein
VRQKGFVSIVIIVVAVAILLGGMWYITGKPGLNLITTPKTVLNEETPNWNVYVNDKYNFSLQYPLNSKVSNRTDSQYQYIRFENYLTDTDIYSSLKENEYYLEIFIFDHSLGQKTDSLCGAKFEEIYITAKDLQGDTGGKGKYSLCVNTKNMDILIDGTEGTKEAPIVNKILSTFELSNHSPVK